MSGIYILTWSHSYGRGSHSKEGEELNIHSLTFKDSKVRFIIAMFLFLKFRKKTRQCVDKLQKYLFNRLFTYFTFCDLSSCHHFQFFWNFLCIFSRFGSVYFAYLIAVFAVLCNGLTVALAVGMDQYFHDSSYLSQCAVGFSGK